MKRITILILMAMFIPNVVFAQFAPIGYSQAQKKQVTVEPFPPGPNCPPKCVMGQGAGCTENVDINNATSPIVQMSKKNLVLENAAYTLSEGMMKSAGNVNSEVSNMVSDCLININGTIFDMGIPTLSSILNDLKTALMNAIKNACNYFATKVKSQITTVVSNMLSPIGQAIDTVNTYAGLGGINISTPMRVGVSINTVGFDPSKTVQVHLTTSTTPDLNPAYGMLGRMKRMADIRNGK